MSPVLYVIEQDSSRHRALLPLQKNSCQMHTDTILCVTFLTRLT